MSENGGRIKGRCWFAIQGMNLSGNRFNQLIDGDRGIVRRGVGSALGGPSNKECI